ncbi:MAG: hypothetical protein ACWGSD_21020, partial [Thermodesulfobacteriota bacterium]
EEETAVFESGMVIAVEVWVVDWSGQSLTSTPVPEVFGNEDYVEVTQTGCNRFPSFRKDIRSLPYTGRVA